MAMHLVVGVETVPIEQGNEEANTVHWPANLRPGLVLSKLKMVFMFSYSWENQKTR